MSEISQVDTQVRDAGKMSCIHVLTELPPKPRKGLKPKFR